MKQAILSLATGAEEQGRNHVSVVLLFTLVSATTEENNGTGDEDTKGVANLIVSIELGLESLNEIVNWFEMPQKKASGGGLTETVGGTLGMRGYTLIRKSRTIVCRPLDIDTAKL